MNLFLTLSRLYPLVDLLTPILYAHKRLLNTTNNTQKKLGSLRKFMIEVDARGVLCYSE